MIGASSEYRIDGKVSNAVDYQELERIGFLLKAKNFLVFEGQVETIALKTPRECRNLFEEISRSIELKDEYDKLKQKVDKPKQKTPANFQKKHCVAA